MHPLLTSETSKRLMYHPNDRFTVDSHAHHGRDILDQILCWEKEERRKKKRTFRITRQYKKRNQ